jgi:hypothetical protein
VMMFQLFNSVHVEELFLWNWQSRNSSHLVEFEELNTASTRTRRLTMARAS